MTEEKYDAEIQESEVDLIALFRRIWDRRWRIIIVTAIFGVLGVFVALISPRSYKASRVFVPQSNQTSANSRLSSLASIAGIELNLDSREGPMSPLVYPQVFANVDFLTELAETPVNFEGFSQPVKLIDFYNDPQYRKKNFAATVARYTIGLPSLLRSLVQQKPADDSTLFASSGAAVESQAPVVRSLTAEQRKAVKALSSVLEIELDKKVGVVMISATMPERVASAQVCEAAYSLLRKYVSKFKVLKAQSNLDYIDGQYTEAKDDYERKQRIYASYQDRHRGSQSAVSMVEAERLYSDMELARSLYSELAKSRMAAQTKVNEDNVVFTDVTPTYVPEKPVKSRLTTVIIWTLLGFIAACVWAVVKGARKETEEECSTE